MKLAKLFPHLDSTMEAEMLKEQTRNPTIRDLAEQVRLAVLIGLDSGDESFVIGTARSLIVQKALAEAMEHFDRTKTLIALELPGQTNREGYA